MVRLKLRKLKNIILDYYIKIRGKLLNVEFEPPNYAFIKKFKGNDVAVDVGTGDDPDFSRFLLEKYHLECFAIDPTRKHAKVLRNIESQINGFHYLPFAVGNRNEEIEFYESLDNMSGSIMPDHRNIVNDRIQQYSVQMVTVDRLLDIVDRPRIAILKLDVEGAEYDLIPTLKEKTLKQIDQLIIEFHHDTVKSRNREDTRKAINIVRRLGMHSFRYSRTECLFYW
jgi:FkbM family methyltransferase